MNRREFTQSMLVTAGVMGLSPLARLVAQDRNVAIPPIQKGETTAFVSGVIYGIRGGRKNTLPFVRVSNGRDVVKTDRIGRYRLPVEEGDVLFVVKPRGYALPVNDLNLPQFYCIHKPSGSSTKEFAGSAPTGPLPTSLDFTLTQQDEPDEFRVLLFGDPQSRNQEEIGFLMRDIIADVADQKAAFGVSLGDIAFNDLSIYANHNRAVAMLGMPWFNLMGNHDINFDAPDRSESAETYKSTFGPTYYSFDYGSTHFVVLDNVYYDGAPVAGTLDTDGKLVKRGTYHTELGAKQLGWLENDLKLVPRDQLVVVMMHIPLINPEGVKEGDMRDIAPFFRLLEGRPHCLSISAHTHFQEHMFLGHEAGWNGAGEHHHLNHVTTCGNWWEGIPDEQGIPHTTMRDGAPNGYSFLNIKGNQYSVDFKAARRPADHQMNIYAPIEVASADLAKTEVLANVFAGSKKSKVEMQIGSGTWLPMQKVAREDPAYVACKAAQDALPKTAGRKMTDVIPSPHMWAANLPAGVPVGAHMIRVRTTDMFGKTFEDCCVVRVA